MQVFAYVRVSTKEQNVERQIEALKQFDIPKRNVFIDYQSGKDFDRPEYKKLIKKLRNGDLLVLKSVDRLGRNYTEILSQWRRITKEIGADILVLDMELLDTRKKNGDLTGVLIADLVLQILAYVAQTEREFIHQRQAEGIAAAKAKGTRFGRIPKQMPDGFDNACKMIATGEMSIREAAESLGISLSTFYRHYRKVKSNTRKYET
ncbi:MAG: recombinase family protein [Clostridia bacterium]|nr:recombinase family protein [Clostridia bacterium]